MNLDGVTGKVAMITGAASGIGRASALAFADAGAKLILGDINREGVEAVADAIKQSGGEAVGLELDITDGDAVNRAVAAAAASFGALHFGINCAGVALAGPPVAEITDEMFDKSVDINLKGAWRCMRAQIPEILRHGGGAIVNVASTMGLVAGPRAGAYVATKHGVVGLTKAAALDYSALGVRVNAVCPGGTDTPMISDEVKQHILAQHPIGRISQPGEIASAILFLASPAASFVTGVALAVDGGWTTH